MEQARTEFDMKVDIEDVIARQRKREKDEEDQRTGATEAIIDPVGNEKPTTFLGVSVFRVGYRENMEKRAEVTVAIGDTTTLLTVYNDPEVKTRARRWNRETANDVSSGRKEVRYMLTNCKGDEQYTGWMPLSSLQTTTTRQLVDNLPQQGLRPLCLVLGYFRQGHSDERQQEVQDDSTTIDVTDKPTASLRVKVFQVGDRENTEKRADVTVDISDTTTLLAVYDHPTVRARARRYNLETFNDVKSGKKEVRYMLTNWEGGEQYTGWMPLSSLQTTTTRQLVDNLPQQGLRPLCLVLACVGPEDLFTI